MNSVTLIGRITHELELQDNGNTQWLNFQLAVANTNPKGDDYFIRCVAFGKTADFMTRWSGKGAKIAVQGRLETSTYEVDGRTVKSYQVVVNNVEPIDWKKNGETAVKMPKGETPEGSSNTWATLDEDIPF